MPTTPVNPSERLRLRPMLIWSAFVALLIVGVVFWFRFSDRILPMIDSLTER